MSDLERPTLKADFDNLPSHTYTDLGYSEHRYAKLFRVADSDDQAYLRDSIKRSGLIEPIMLFEGAILDGRHRYKACIITGTEPRFEEFTGTHEEAVRYVLGKNLARRQLKAGERAAAILMAEEWVGELKSRAASRAPASGEARPGKVAAVLAAEAGTSRATMERMIAVKKAADEFPEDDFLQDMFVKAASGEVPVNTAYKATRPAYDPDEIDRMAKKQAAMTDTNKLKATLGSAIGKAHALLINADPSVLTSSYELREQLMDLEVWINEALNFVL